MSAAGGRRRGRAKGQSGYGRLPRDSYYTPSWVGEWIARHVALPEVVWEPAAGAGHLAMGLRAGGAGTVLCTDIEPAPAPLCRVDRADFYHCRVPLEAMLGGYGIVTNPPFGVLGLAAARFARRALCCSARVVVLLLPVDFDSGSTRADLFRDCEAWAEKIVLLDRLSWANLPAKRHPMHNHALYVWRADHPGGTAGVRYARRGDLG